MNNPGHSKLHLTRLFYTLFAALVIELVSACGGGGSSSSKPKMSVNSPTVLEGDENTTEVVFTVTLNKSASSALTVNVATTDGTADSSGLEADYTPVNETLTIAKGSRSASVSVYVNGDTELEAHETFTLTVSNPQGLKLDSSTQSLTATATITNDEDVDPKGYFNGTATLNSTEYDDITALIYDSRVLMFSPTANVVYDINLNSPDSVDYEGTVDLYVDGLLVQADSITVTGETTNDELSGSFSGGTDFGVGSFEVAFDEDNNTGAGSDYSRIGPEHPNWEGDFHSVDTIGAQMGFQLDGFWGGGANAFPVCLTDNPADPLPIPSPEVNIFQLSNDIRKSSANCLYGYEEPYQETDRFSGFASVINVTGTDDGLVFVETNGTYSIYSIMDRP